MAFLVDTGCESAVKSTPHYFNGEGTNVMADKVCSGLFLRVSYRGGGGHSGFGTSAYESTSTESVSFDDNDEDGYSPDDSPGDCLDEEP